MATMKRMLVAIGRRGTDGNVGGRYGAIRFNRILSQYRRGVRVGILMGIRESPRCEVPIGSRVSGQRRRGLPGDRMVQKQLWSIGDQSRGWIWDRIWKYASHGGIEGNIRVPFSR